MALTNNLPAFSFEAPGDLMYASRIGLLPEILPTPGNKRPNYTDFLSSLNIYHYGNTDDPIYMGKIGTYSEFRNLQWNHIRLLLV